MVLMVCMLLNGMNGTEWYDYCSLYDGVCTWGSAELMLVVPPKGGSTWRSS